MNILAIGAHPDDIEFGCGGTLIRHSRAGHTIHFLIMTDGRYGADPKVRRAEQKAACAYLGARLHWGGFSDTEVQDMRELIVTMERVIASAKPDTVYVNYEHDVHQDHRIIAQAAISATRYLREVLFYEVPSTRHFEPDVFVDIRDCLKDKMALLKIHASQVDKTKVENLTILESAQSCANFRGYQGRVKYAEGFKALRVLKTLC